MGKIRYLQQFCTGLGRLEQTAEQRPAQAEQDLDIDQDEWLDGDAGLNNDADEIDDQDELAQAVETEANLICDDAQAGVTPQDYLDDAEFGNMYRYLRDGTLTGDQRTDRTTLLACEFYFLRRSNVANHDAGLLYKVKLPKGKRGQPLTMDRLCVPKKARAEILFRAHDICVHSGRQKTYLTISNRFYWKNLLADVYSYVKSCDVCQKSCRNYARILHHVYWT